MKKRITVDRSGYEDIYDANEKISELFADACAGSRIFTTSGTTGKPKLIRHSMVSLTDNARQFNYAAGIGEEVVMYNCFSLTYMAGFLNTIISPIIAGGRTVIGPKFNPIGFWETPLKHGCNTLWLSPTMAAALIRASRSEEEELMVSERFKAIFCGTAALSMDIRIAWLEKFRVPLRLSYGTTEAMLVSVQTHDQAVCCEDNCGYMFPDTYCDTDPVTGELYIHSARNGRTYKTGDAGGAVGGSMVLEVIGRLDDLIIRGGAKIDPVVIEEKAKLVDGVTDAAAVAVVDEFWGHAVHLFVESQRDVYNDVMAKCRDTLPMNHMPGALTVMEKFPRTENGKTKKSQLRGSASR